MTHAHSTTLWCEASLRFYDTPSLRDRSYNSQNLKNDDLRPRYHQAPFADVLRCPSITIYSEDWKESATYHQEDSGLNWGRLNPHYRTVWHKHGHNWYNVTRVDITFIPHDVPFYFQGTIYTGGLSSHTTKLRRLKSHQISALYIPPDARFTPLENAITQADWTTTRHCRHGWLNRTTRHTAFCYRTPTGWHFATTYHQALSNRVLHRLNLAA